MRRLSRVRVLNRSDRGLMLDLKSIVARFVADATLILYGSAARGKRTPESDYDVLVLLEAPIDRQTREEMRSAIYELELEREVVVSLMVSTREEWNSPPRSLSPFHRNVESDGVLL
jgi:uncharacterized protein